MSWLAIVAAFFAGAGLVLLLIGLMAIAGRESDAEDRFKE